MISDYIKQSTRPLHDQTEAKFNSEKIFAGTFTFEDYLKLLRYNYVFLLNYESAVFDAISAKNAALIHLPKRKKLPLLENEWNALNLDPLDPDFLPTVKNEAEAFGILYVMEGSTLGGNMIAKQLSKRQDFAKANFEYFRVYGEHTGSFWKNFKTVLDHEIVGDKKEDCVLGANKAYQFLLHL